MDHLNNKYLSFSENKHGFIIYYKKIKFAQIIKEKCIGALKKTEFFTDNNDNLQVGYISRTNNEDILPHKHELIKRTIDGTNEVLIIISGSADLILYDFNDQKLCETYLNKGDIVILFEGGHGLKNCNNFKIIEVKQGPYLNQQKDKTLINDL